jgi:hypothetical protein
MLRRRLADQRRVASEVPVPVPRYRDFVVAADRRLWIRLLEPRPGDSTRYLLVDPYGDVVERLSLPPRSAVLAVQPPWVLTLLREEDDIERLAVTRLGRP